MSFALCAVVPTFDNPTTIEGVARRLREVIDTVIVVDDGSHDAGRAAVEALRGEPGLVVVRREKNGGKGAAVLDGLAEAKARGFTHALQVDADAQHDLADLPRFVAAARAFPEALVLGSPRFGRDAPLNRMLARRLARFWTHVETLGVVVDDPMCGYRVYPIARLPERVTGARMAFDNEVVVRMVWNGTSVVNLPTRVTYPQDGVSHYHLFADTARIVVMHVRLVFGTIARLPTLWARGGRRLESRSGDVSA